MSDDCSRVAGAGFGDGGADVVQPGRQLTVNELVTQLTSLLTTVTDH